MPSSFSVGGFYIFLFFITFMVGLEILFDTTNVLRNLNYGSNYGLI